MAGNYTTADRRKSNAARLPMLVGLGLIVLKGAAALMTGSLAIVGSLLDSVMDLLASTGNFIALRHAELPPDSEHRWGHGKAESLSSLAQAGIVVASVAVLITQAVGRLANPESLRQIDVGIWAMVLSIGGAGMLTWHLRRTGEELDSLALSSDALHYLSDLLTNAGAVVGLLAFKYWKIEWLDSAITLVMALVLLRSAFEIGRSAVDQLMDHELPEDEQKRIHAVLIGVSDRIFGVHEMRTRRSGSTTVIDVHMEMDAELSFVAAHAVTAKAQHALECELGDVIVTIHADPCRAAGVVVEDECSHVGAEAAL